MYILAVETTGKYGTAAVTDGEGRIWSASSENEMNHLKDIISLCDSAIKGAGISKKELTHIASSVGPGSFTGIRIGVTTARTMAQMLELPCVSVSSLEAMALRALDDAKASGADYIAAIINARRHQTYAGVWKLAKVTDDDSSEGSDVAPEYTLFLEEKQYMIEELLEEIKSKCSDESGEMAGIFFTGDGIDAYESIITDALPEGKYTLADESVRYQDAAEVALIACRKAEAGETVSYEEMLPEYMRLSEAEQRLKEGTLSDKIKKLK